MKIAVLSGKGGVGKTLLAINLSVIFAKEGYKVLLVDANFSAPTIATYFKTIPNSNTMDEVLQRGGEGLENMIWIHPSGVHFITPSFNLVSLDDETLQNLFTIMEPLFPNYDFVIFDGPAGVEKDTHYVVHHSDGVLLVANPNYPSLYNALKVNYFAQAAGKSVIGAVLNMVTGKDEVSVQEAQQILETQIIGVIPFDPAIKKAVNEGVPIVMQSPSSKASKAYYEIASTLLGKEVKPKEGGSDWQAWIKRIIDFLLS